MRSATGLYALILGAAFLAYVPSVSAQGQSPSTPPTASPPAAAKPAPGKPSADIPDKKLDAAAAAVKNVTAVKQNYEQKYAQAPAAEKPHVADEANAAMARAVTDQGISIEEYKSILEVAQNDPVVQKKILDRLK